MKVHIVTTDATSDWVCARHARYLIHAFGWTTSARPDPNADVNLFLPYLFYKEDPGTATAGWFTHYDIASDAKAEMWRNAAREVSLRASQAAQYAPNLSLYGDAIHIPGAVELDLFTPTQRRGGKRVGVSGMVYPGGRKGEQLVYSLHNTREWELVASGQGWPVPTRKYAWEQMPEYYRGLDVFLCASTIEGGPITVLEALACGVPVVVPAGVGLVDELPDDMSGIVRYKAGDVDAARKAIETALDDRGDPEELRSVAMGYSVDRWTETWYETFESMTSTGWIPQEPRADWHNRAGVYVVAYGENARDCAKVCIDSVHQHMPGLPVALASDRTLGTEDVLVNAPDLDIGARAVKTQIYDRAPAEWEYVLYLDADCRLEAPVPFLFDALADGWDLLICTNPDKYHIARHMRRPDNQDEADYTFDKIGGEEIIQYQGGVFSFRRSSKTAAFFRNWHEEWNRYGKRDQGALLRTVFDYPIRIYLLGTTWNRSSRYPEDTPYLILHSQMTARRHEGIISGRSDSEEAWEAVARWKQGRQA